MSGERSSSGLSFCLQSGRIADLVSLKTESDGVHSISSMSSSHQFLYVLCTGTLLPTSMLRLSALAGTYDGKCVSLSRHQKSKFLPCGALACKLCLFVMIETRLGSCGDPIKLGRRQASHLAAKLVRGLFDTRAQTGKYCAHYLNTRRPAPDVDLGIEVATG